jgi:hypothetical protein
MMISSPTSPIALLLITLSLLPVGTAQATDEIYKQVDAHGNVTYSNRPIKGGKKVNLPPLSTLPPKPLPPPKAEAQAVAEPTTEQHRKELLEAIAKEEKALEAAKAAAKAGAEKPEVYRHTRTIVGKDGKPATITETGRNVAAYEEKMKKLNEEVALHEKSLAALKTELASPGKNKP